MKTVGGAWFLYKMRLKNSPTKRKSLIKKEKEEEEDTKKILWVANNSLNDWKFQLNWNKLEWVDPRTCNCKTNPFCTTT